MAKFNRIELRQYIQSKEFDEQEFDILINDKKLIIEDFCCHPKPVLPEDFLRRHTKDINWWQVTRNKKLSESFMREMYDFIDWTGIIADNVSDDFYREIFYREKNKKPHEIKKMK